MTASEASVTTERPARYGKQLVAHLSRRSNGEWSESDEQGWVEFEFGRAHVTCAPGTLHLKVDGPVAALDRLEDVVGRHLVRFGTRDELVVTWIRDDGTAGTEQRFADPDEAART